VNVFPGSNLIGHDVDIIITSLTPSSSPPARRRGKVILTEYSDKDKTWMLAVISDRPEYRVSVVDIRSVAFVNQGDESTA
jgi:hypothetical protein